MSYKPFFIKGDWKADHRVCTSCLKEKPFSAYHKHSLGRFGLRSKCKDCYNMSIRKKAKEGVYKDKKDVSDLRWRLNNKDKRSAAFKKWRVANLEVDAERQNKRRAKRTCAIPLW